MMTRMTRDTAWRSLQDLFRSLPPEATIEIVMDGAPPHRGTLSVRVELGEPARGDVLRTWAAPTEPGEDAAKTPQPKTPAAKTSGAGNKTLKVHLPPPAEPSTDAPPADPHGEK